MPSQHEVPEHNTRHFVWIMLGLTVVACGCLACCGVGAWFAVDRIGDIPVLGDFADAELPPPVVESADEKQAWLKAAFADPPPDGGFDRRSLDVFFQRVVDASQEEDGSAFQRLVDEDRFWRSIKERGLIKELTRGDDRSYPAYYLEDLESPGTFDRHFIQAITPADRPDEAVAYVIFWEDGWVSEYRWWLVRDGRLWKAYDWEPLQGGIRQSMRHAAYVADVPRLASYDAFWVALERVYARQGEGKLFEATQKLREASRVNVPPLFAAEHKMQAAYAFSQLGRALPEIEIYEQATTEQRQAAPGLLLGWAMQASIDDDFDRALELAARYEQEIGGGPNVEQLRADSLAALGRTSEAAPHYLRLLKFSPDDVYLQSQAARYLPPDRLDAIVDLLKQRPDPAKATHEAAAYSAGEPPVLRAYEMLLAELSPKSPELDVVRGMRLHAEGNVDGAADAFLAAYKKAKQMEEPDVAANGAASAEDPNDAGNVESDVATTGMSDEALSYFHELFWEADRPMEAYERSPDQQAAFEYLTYQADEYGMSAERRRELVERHSATAPDDPSLLAMRAQAAADGGNHAEAATLWPRVIAAGEDFRYYASSAANSFIQLGRIDDAVALARAHPDDMGLLYNVSAGLQKAERYEDLLAIAELPRGEELKDNQAIAFAKADALAGLGRFDEAEAVLNAQLDLATEDWSRRGVCQKWLEIADEANWPTIRYLDLAGRESMPVLIGVCEESARQRLENLIAEWKQRGGSAEVALPAEVSLLWDQQNFEAIVQRVNATGGPTALVSSSGSTALRHYVRSLLQTNRTQEALDAAQVLYDATGEELPLIVAQMLKSDWAAAEKTAAVASDFTRQNLYLDPVALPLLRSENAAAFRRHFPRDGQSLARTLAVILLPEPLTGTRGEQMEQMRLSVSEIAADAVVKPFDTTDGPQLAVQNSDKEDWLIAWGAEAYFPQSDASMIENDEYRELIQSQRGWVAIDWAGGQSGDADSAWSGVGELLGKIAPSNASLLLLQTSHGRFLCRYSQQLIDQMRSAGFTSADIEDRELCYLYREDESSPTTRLSQTFPEFAQAFANRSEGDSFTVDAVLTLPHGRVPISVPVERVVLRTYTIEIVANADGLPEPLRRLFPGDRLALDGWSMTGWSYTKDGQTVRSTDLLGDDGTALAEPAGLE